MAKFSGKIINPSLLLDLVYGGLMNPIPE